MTEQQASPPPGVDRAMVLFARARAHALRNLKRPIPQDLADLAAIDPFSVPSTLEERRSS